MMSDVAAPRVDPESLDPTEEELALLEAPGAAALEQVEEQPDGSAVIYAEDGTPEPGEFDSNLAEDGTFTDSELDAIGADLCELIESDKKSREQRDKQYAEGIKRTGLGNEAPGGADFDGASRAVHPMLAKGCVDFASRAIKELFPATGPCRTQVIGEATEDKLDRAERKKTFMNWQLTTQVMENRAEYERLLSQLPLGGSQFKRWWWDPVAKRPRTETVYVDDVFLPFEQNDFYSAHRITHRQRIDHLTFEARVESGLYRELNLVDPSGTLDDQSQAAKASDRVEGVEQDAAYNEIGLREVYQVYLDTAYDEDALAEGQPAPYVVHVDKYQQKVLGIFRNWRADDPARQRKHWMVEYTFLPWRGAYGVGLAHLIGSLAGAATGALRALLDSAHIQNFPGALMLEGGRTAGQSIQVNATELTPIKPPPNVDDIRKMIMPFPFNGPSNVLMTLLEFLGQQAEIVVATASEKIADGGANMPMGTALALIEHGAVNFSAIHARMHASLKRELEIVNRLNAENLSDRETVEDLGELVVSRKDFAGPMDIIPVSDPNIFSEAQRYAQIQAVLGLKSDPVFMPFFKPERLLQRALKLLQIPAPEDIANLPQDPKKLAPLEENYACSIEESIPLKVYWEQDDVAHLEAHLAYAVSPVFGGSPLIGAKALPALVGHCKEHLLNLYKKHTTAASKAMGAIARAEGLPLTEAQAQAKGAAFADQLMVQLLGPMVLPALQQAMKLAGDYAPKPPPDPSVMVAQIREQSTTQREAARLEFDKADSQAKLMNERQIADINAAIEFQDQQTNKALAQFAASVEVIRDKQKAQSAEMMAQLKAEHDKELATLNALLTQGMESVQGALQVADLPGAVEPLITKAVSTTSEQILAQMQAFAEQSRQEREALSAVVQQAMSTITQLQQYNDAERVAEYVMGPDGTKRGVRSYIKRPDGTPDRVREFPLPSNPAAQQQQPQPQLPAPPAPGAMP